MINDIYKVCYMKNKFEYVGLLRNAKRFNINDKVFFALEGNSIAFGRIVGVQLLPRENPEYTYEITISEELVKQHDVNITMIRTCDKIFNTVEEAKESALKNLEHMYNLQSEELERYFAQFMVKEGKKC